MQSLKDFYSANSIKRQSIVKLSEKGYPYMTFIPEEGEAINIWFSVDAGKKVQQGQTLAELDFENMLVVDVDYEDERESRKKLTFGSGDYSASPFG